MKRMTFIELAGKKYPLIFSLGASKALSAKFGDISRIGEMLGSGKMGVEEIDSITYIVTVLIKQGVAYKNMFEADLPVEEGVRYENGKYIALSQEEVEVAVALYDIDEIVNKITECVAGSSTTEIEAETESKNA